MGLNKMIKRINRSAVVMVMGAVLLVPQGFAEQGGSTDRVTPSVSTGEQKAQQDEGVVERVVEGAKGVSSSAVKKSGELLKRSGTAIRSGASSVRDGSAVAVDKVGDAGSRAWQSTKKVSSAVVNRSREGFGKLKREVAGVEEEAEVIDKSWPQSETVGDQ